MDTNRIYQGDCRAIMRRMIGAGVRPQCVVTSPPYWALRDYGVSGQFGLERTWVRHVARMRGVFRLVRELLRDDGLLWLNYGDSYCSTDKWGGGGNGNTGKQTVAADGSVPSWAVRRRREKMAGIKPKDLIGMPWRVAFALQHDGWWLRSDIVWAKPNPMPESIRDRPTKSHEYIFMMAKSARYYYDAEAIREPGSPDTHARLSRANKGYSPPGQDEHEGTAGPRANARRPGVNPKATANQRHPAGWAAGPGRHSTIEHAAGAGTRGSKYAQASPQIKGGDRMANLPAGKTESRDTTQMRPKWCKQNESFSEAISGDITVDRNVRTVWNIATEGTEFAHFATFPRALVARCILASTRPGDIVFDPFAGSGTTCEVAESLGRRFIGAELNPEYIKIFTQHRKTTIGLAL